jgi:hypothetical protein
MTSGAKEENDHMYLSTFLPRQWLLVKKSVEESEARSGGSVEERRVDTTESIRDLFLS